MMNENENKQKLYLYLSIFDHSILIVIVGVIFVVESINLFTRISKTKLIS